MNPPRRKLPIGIQTFSEIISEGHYYVDKTRLAHQLIQSGKYYFLSRPRRFGKSLFLDTLKELFEGNQTLFQGLHIHDKWDWATRFPVVRISFNDGGLKNSGDLERRIHSILSDNFERLDLPCPEPVDIIVNFKKLIRGAHEKYGQRVAILVDEYDKPILDHIDDSAIALGMREVLKGFYSVIKGADENVRFAIVTGVSKFSKVSLFSGLNNLNDITLDARYSAICGYTDADIDGVFAPELEGLARAEIRRWYNGYNWRGESVYNPFDVLLLFDRREFGNWWFLTATPTFLVKLLIKREVWLPNLGHLVADAELMDCFDVDTISTTALMFQTGYLTIASEEWNDGEISYLLRFPNHEVSRSFYSSLLGGLVANLDDVAQNKKDLRRLLAAHDVGGLEALFHAFFASIPYHWHTNNPIGDYEGYYASVFYGYFAALGLGVRVEDASNRGRIDMAVRHSGHVWLFEFKVVERTPAGGALQQIKDKGYAEKYRAEGLPIHLVGVEFSSAARNVVGFEAELA